MLEREGADAAAQLEQARVAVRAIVSQVMQADAEALLAEMRAAERRAAELRVLVLGLGNSLTTSDPRPPAHLSVALANEPAGVALLGTFTNLPDWTTTAARWGAYRAALAADANARMRDGEAV